MKKLYSLFFAALLAMLGFQSSADVAIIGNDPFGGWSLSGGKAMTLVDGIYTLSVENVSAGVYFAILDGNQDWSNVRRPSSNGAVPTGDWENTSTGGDNSWKTDVAGNYTFEYNQSTHQLKVTVADPVSVEPAYYLVGEVPGWSENDDYKFVNNNGVFTLTTVMSGQFKIKDEKGNWYGNGKTFTAEDNTATLGAGDNNYLAEESEYTFTIENNVLTITGFPTTPVIPDKAYYLVGNFNTWNTSSHPFTKVSDGVFSITETFNGEFKIVDENGSWLGGSKTLTAEDNTISVASDEGGNMKLEAESEYTLTIENDVLTVTGFPTTPVIPDKAYYLVGDFNDWSLTANPFTEVSDGVFSITETVSGAFKIVDEYGSWLGGEKTLTAEDNTISVAGDEGGNMNLENEAEYTFTIENDVLTVTGFPVDEILSISLVGAEPDAEWGTVAQFVLNAQNDLYEVGETEIAAGFKFKLIVNKSLSGDTWVGAVSDGDFLVSPDLLGVEISMETPGDDLYFEKAGTFSFSYDPENAKLTIEGEFVPELRTISGVVKDSDDLPLEGVTVTAVPVVVPNADGIRLKENETLTTTTDANGAYSLDVPANEEYNLTFAKDGYVEQTVPEASAGNVVLAKAFPTAIERIANDKNVAGVKYVSVSGLVSDKPFDGINIVVINYLDGTTATMKLRK